MLTLNRKHLEPFMRFILFLLFSLVINFSVKSQCNLKNTTFVAGETLKYTVFYNLSFIWLEVADIELATSEIMYKGKKCIKLASTWKTRPKYDWIVHVDDKYEAVIHNDSLKAYEYNQKIIEGKYVSNVKYIYQHPQKEIYIWMDDSGKGKKYDSIQINNCAFDLLTVIYFIRNLNYPSYKSNQKIRYSAILSDTINNMEIKYAGIESVKSSEGKPIICHKIKPSVVETEMFKGGSDKLTAWFSNDRNQLPISAESELFIGSVKVILKSYKGLRYPAKY
jgi:hypothetical protein